MTNTQKGDRKPLDKAANAAADMATEAARSVGKAVDRIGQMGRDVLFRPLHLPGLSSGKDHTIHGRPGGIAGIEGVADLDIPPEAGAVKITCLEYSTEKCESREVSDIDVLLEEERPDWAKFRWINIDGLNPYVVNRCKEALNLHTLAAEDTLLVPQRPKLEAFDQYQFLITRVLMLKDRELVSEQVSMYLFKDVLLTFQEFPGDIWDPIRERLATPGSRLRQNGVDFLLYALLDTAVDHCFPILEAYSERLERLEAVVIERPQPRYLQTIHSIKRELGTLRRVIWPMREVIDVLYRDEHEMLSQTTRTFMRDVYDHAVQIMDIVETHREMAGGLTDLYMSAISNRMNEIMKVLTIMASFFIPITFVAGVYGMNFEHMPELSFRYSYPIFWGVVILMVVSLLFYFRSKKWIGRGP